MSQETVPSIFKIIRIERVMQKTGMSKSTIFKERARGKFPEPVQLSRRCVGWLESEVDAWIKQRITQRATLASNQKQGRSRMEVQR